MNKKNTKSVYAVQANEKLKIRIQKYTGVSVYEGQMKEHKKRGKITYKKHGKGAYTYASGSVYVGEWIDDKKHGKGAYTFAGSSVYVGEWKEDNMHGKGSYTW